MEVYLIYNIYNDRFRYTAQEFSYTHICIHLYFSISLLELMAQ